MPQQGTSGIPPNRVVAPAVRRATLSTFLGGIVVVFVLAAGAFIYFTVIDKTNDAGAADPSAVGTSGERMRREGTPGGFDPALENRGGASDSVKLEGVQVERAVGATFWVRDGDTSVAVTAPGGMPTVRAGQRVNVTGTRDASGRIRASRIDVK